MNIDEAINESYTFLNQFQLNIFGPDNMGNVWQPIYNRINSVGVGQNILYYYNTPFFNIVQRTQARWLRLNNAYCQAGITNLVNMIFGEGFQYICDNKSMQKQLDEWMTHNKFKQVAREAAEKLFVDGEQFYRLFNNGEDLRFVDPQWVYDEKYNGIQTDEDDYCEVLAYYIAGKKVTDVETIQQRKLGWTEEKRGISLIYSVGPSFLEASGLLTSIAQTAKALSKIAWLTYTEASKQSVETMVGDVHASLRQNAPSGAICNDRNVDEFPAGSTLYLPKGMKMEFPGQYLDGEKYVTVLRAILRMIAARFGLPETTFSDNENVAAYNGQLVAESHVVKGLKNWQEKFVEWDLELFEKAGFDRTKIKVELPEIAAHDKGDQVAVAGMLLDRELAGPSTICSMFGLNYDEEKQQIKTQGYSVDTNDGAKDEPKPE